MFQTTFRRQVPFILTEAAPGTPFKDESIWDSSIPTQIWELPLPHDTRRKVFCKDENVIAEMQGSGPTL